MRNRLTFEFDLMFKVILMLLPTPENRPSYRYVHALLVLMTLLVAGSFPLGGMMMQSLSQSGQSLTPSQLMLLRFVLAALIFAPYIYFRFGLVLPTVARLRVYVALAVPLVVFFCSMFTSLETTSVLNTGALFTLVPVFSALYARWINRERSSARRNVGLLLGTMGAIWIVFRGDVSALLALQLHPGDGIFLFGCLFLGAYQPLVKRWHTQEPVAVMTFWVLMMASVLLLIFVVFTATASGTALAFWPDWQQLPATVYWGLLYLVVFTTLLSFFLQQLGALTLGAARSAAYSLLTPVFVMGMSFFLEPHAFSWIVLPGILLVVMGLIFIQRER
ncbi:DMT family transporter [Photobacterium japonica]|uniref:DMT family transporter n=1 Tax=Photobacterium japonica TaxID=2910235 RepID=UPI003D0CE667